MPVYWLLEALGLSVLIVFGRREDALLAWLIYIAAFWWGWMWIVPTFMA